MTDAAGTRTVLHLGAGLLMVPTIRQLQEAGLRVYAIDRNPRAPGLAVADGGAPLDIADIPAVTTYARDIRAEVILAVNEAGVLAATDASEALGLRNVPRAVAERCLDKGLMRTCWDGAGLPQPDFRVVTSAVEVAAAAQTVGYPVVVKPTLNWGSRGVSFASSPQDLPWSADFAWTHARNGRVIVERAVRGTEITLEGLVQDGDVAILARSDKEAQAHPRFRVAMALNYPAEIPAATLAAADEIVRQAARALGIRDGAIHCECMVTETGVFLVELAVRPGGGHIFGQIVQAVSGVPMPLTLTRIFLGEQPDIQPRSQLGACYRFFSPPAGRFRAVHGLEAAARLPGILDMGFSMAPGTEVGAIEGDADRPGYMVTSGLTRSEAMARADAAIAALRFEMEPVPEPQPSPLVVRA